VVFISIEVVEVSWIFFYQNSFSWIKLWCY